MKHATSNSDHFSKCLPILRAALGPHALLDVAFLHIALLHVTQLYVAPVHVVVRRVLPASGRLRCHDMYLRRGTLCAATSAGGTGWTLQSPFVKNKNDDKERNAQAERCGRERNLKRRAR